jgi:hypothetical protein
MADWYTKSILTIIAACLVWNIAAGLTGTQQAIAQSGQMHVVVDQWGPYMATMPIQVTVR